MAKSKKSASSAKSAGPLLSAFKSIDLYGQAVSFQVGDGATFNSTFGAFLSLAIFVITISFGVKRF